MASPRASHLLIVFAVSCLALTYEVVLIRLLTISQDASYIGVVISLALLGFGYSGSFLVWIKDRLQSPQYFRRFIILHIIAFPIAIGACTLLSIRYSVHPGELLWDKSLLFDSFMAFFILSVPFFLASNLINATMVVFPSGIHRIYAFDLWGAGLGGIAALFLLPSIHSDLLPMSSYKPLSRTRLQPGVEELVSQSTRHATTVVLSSAIPFRYAPGLSLAHVGEFPQQLGLFVDGSTFFPITANNKHKYYLDTPEGLFYSLTRPVSVLMWGLGGGDGVRLARASGAHRIDVIELDPNRLELLKTVGKTAPPFALDTAGVSIGPRLAVSEPSYDLIHISEIGGSPSAFQVTAHDLLGILTIDTMAALKQTLKSQGGILVSIWKDMPPHRRLKVESLLAASFPNPRINVLESLQTLSYSVLNNDALVTALRAQATELGFKLHDFNAFRTTSSVLFDASVPTLDKPFISGALRLEPLWEFVRHGLDPRRLPVDPSFFLPWFALLAALFFSFILILLPLVPLARERRIFSPLLALRFICYFTALGLGFLWVEVTAIQKLKLILGQGIVATVLMLATFLIFAGLGSLTAKQEFFHRRFGTALLFAALIGAVIAAFLSMNLILQPIADIRLQCLVAVLLWAPAAFLMGIPFALGIRRLAVHSPSLVAWAWAINGSASVVSAILAQMLYPYFGFLAVLLMAALLYGGAWMTVPQKLR